MGKGVKDLDPAIRQMFFHRLPSGGGVDRNQAEAEGLPDRQPGGTELPLDQGEIAGPGRASPASQEKTGAR